MIGDAVSEAQSWWGVGTFKAGGGLPAGGAPGRCRVSGEEQGPGGPVRPGAS